MPSVIRPPSIDHFNSLPDVMESHEVLQDRCSEELLSRICSLFVEHDVHQTFGLALVHQHFDLEQDEQLLNVGNVAVPVKAALMPTPVAPTRWDFVDGMVVPYEFSTDADSIDMDHHGVFINKLGNLLQARKLSGYLGLCSFDSIAGGTEGSEMEFTSGRANITLPFDVHAYDAGSVEASWQVETASGPGFKFKGKSKCKIRCVKKFNEQGKVYHYSFHQTKT